MNQQFLEDIRRWFVDAANAKLQRAGRPPAWSHHRKVPFWDGGTTRTGRKRANIWEKIAALIIRERLPPQPFIEWAVDYYGETAQSTANTVPRPNLLLSQRTVEEFQWCQRNRGPSMINNDLGMMQDELDRQIREFRAAVGVASTWFPHTSEKQWVYTALLNMALEVSPLFRFCVASRYGFEELCVGSQEAAASQYRACPDQYQQVWGQIIPMRLMRGAMTSEPPPPAPYHMPLHPVGQGG